MHEQATGICEFPKQMKHREYRCKNTYIWLGTFSKEIGGRGSIQH